jgi:hypothetical protein
MTVLTDRLSPRRSVPNLLQMGPLKVSFPGGRLYWRRWDAAWLGPTTAPVSDLGTLGGLTQFLTQFGFPSSATGS